MAAFTLSKNSKFQPGRTWPKTQGKKFRDFKIYRWNPDDGKSPLDGQRCIPIYQKYHSRDAS